MELDLFNQPSGSPFDSIKREEGGREFWSARDLMPVMGYSAWRNFEVPLQRAMKSAEVQGHDVATHFAGSRKVSGERGPAQQDYEMSRFAAYLVAMNGDPNKSEVAAAQSYFAIRTREAETAVKAPAELSRKELALMILESEEAREAAELETARARTELAVAEPKVEAYEAFLDADGTYSVGEVAKMLGYGQNHFFRLLRQQGVLIAGGHLHNTPYARYAHHFKVTARTYDGGDGLRTSHTTSVRPSGVVFLRGKLNSPPSMAA